MGDDFCNSVGLGGSERGVDKEVGTLSDTLVAEFDDLFELLAKVRSVQNQKVVGVGVVVFSMGGASLHEFFADGKFNRPSVNRRSVDIGKKRFEIL